MLSRPKCERVGRLFSLNVCLGIGTLKGPTPWIFTFSILKPFFGVPLAPSILTKSYFWQLCLSQFMGRSMLACLRTVLIVNQDPCDVTRICDAWEGGRRSWERVGEGWAGLLSRRWGGVWGQNWLNSAVLPLRTRWYCSWKCSESHSKMRGSLFRSGNLASNLLKNVFGT